MPQEFGHHRFFFQNVEIGQIVHRHQPAFSPDEIDHQAGRLPGVDLIARRAHAPGASAARSLLRAHHAPHRLGQIGYPHTLADGYEFATRKIDGPGRFPAVVVFFRRFDVIVHEMVHGEAVPGE